MCFIASAKKYQNNFSLHYMGVHRHPVNLVPSLIRHCVVLYLQFDWLLYLNTFMPMPITEEEPIVTLVPDYLRDMARLVSQQEKRSASKCRRFGFIGKNSGSNSDVVIKRLHCVISLKSFLRLFSYFILFLSLLWNFNGLPVFNIHHCSSSHRTV